MANSGREILSGACATGVTLTARRLPGRVRAYCTGGDLRHSPAGSLFAVAATMRLEGVL